MSQARGVWGAQKRAPRPTLPGVACSRVLLSQFLSRRQDTDGGLRTLALQTEQGP